MPRDNDTANTAMFQAFVDDDLAEQLDPPGQDKAKLVKIIAVVAAVLVAVGLLVALS